MPPLKTPPSYQIEREGTTYFATALDHDETYMWNETIVDFGIRPRLWDEEGDLFDSFTMTLADISGPGEFALFAPHPIFGTTVFAYNTADNVVSYDWEPWGHEHWHWGFTVIGDYELVFDFHAQFPDERMTAAGSKTVNFEVIPEPATMALLAGIGIFGVVLWSRSRRRD